MSRVGDETMEVQLLGPLRIRVHGADVPLRGFKQRSVLGFLLLHAGESIRAERVVEAVWGFDPPAGAGRSLQTYISNLRKLLEPGRERGAPWSVIETTKDGYRLDATTLDLDAERFDELVATAAGAMGVENHGEAAAHLAAALDLCSIEPLGDLGHEHWALPFANHMRERRVEAQALLFDAELALGHHDSIVGDLAAATAEHPYKERFWAQRMLALFRAGRQEEALRAYGELRTTLGEELGIEPSEELRNLEGRILLQDATLNLAGHAKGNLPALVSAMVGREDEVEELSEAIRHYRLVTLTGAGGTGKTRLALEVAAACRRRYRDGAWFVDLASAADPEPIATAIVAAIGLPQQTAQPAAEAVEQGLADRHLLVVLDNCDHLVDRVGEVVRRLLDHCPALTVMATSRRSLELPGEYVHAVDPLSFPWPAPTSLAELLEYPAPRLFAERSLLPVGEDDAAAIASICSSLAGMPLAIELAAARTRVLSLSQIADRLDQQLVLLATAGSTEPRHRAMRAALDWSYDVLDADEQSLFRMLSVFRGGAGLEAVMAMSDDESRVLDVLDRLVSRSMVLARPAPFGMRYELLEPVRQYADEKLDQEEERDEAFARHWMWAVDFAGKAELRVRRSDQLVWLERTETEHENLRTALDRAYRSGRIDVCVSIAGSLSWFWFLHSRVDDSERWLPVLVEEGKDVDDRRGYVRLLFGSAQHRWETGRVDEARSLLGRGLEVGERMQSETLVAWAHAYLSMVEGLDGHFDRFEAHADEARRRFMERGDAAGIGFLAWNRVMMDAIRLDQGLPGVTSTPDEMRDALEPVVLALRMTGDRNLLGHALFAESLVARLEGNLGVAAQTLSEGTIALFELGNTYCLGHHFMETAFLLQVMGDVDRAVLVLAAAESLRGRLDAPGPPVEQLRRATLRDGLRAVIALERFEELWQEGSALSIEDAVQVATAGSDVQISR